MNLNTNILKDARASLVDLGAPLVRDLGDRLAALDPEQDVHLYAFDAVADDWSDGIDDYGFAIVDKGWDPDRQKVIRRFENEVRAMLRKEGSGDDLGLLIVAFNAALDAGIHHLMNLGH